uniref:Uncharacterized protein n=1 Tax=Tanacetum cinerariifolium TaxID=118510 RepID=A0A6L2LK98_TANCI|nr:hypothetical protein [Tanacetum cinerariifolium]
MFFTSIRRKKKSSGQDSLTGFKKRRLNYENYPKTRKLIDEFNLEEVFRENVKVYGYSRNEDVNRNLLNKEYIDVITIDVEVERVKNDASKKKKDFPETKQDWLSIRTRGSPKVLYNLMKNLSPAQMKDIIDIGFGSMIGMAFEEIPGKIAHFVVDNFDDDSMKLKLSNGVISITLELVYKVLGVPLGGEDINRTNRLGSEDVTTLEWHSQISNKNPTPKKVYDKIQESQMGGILFKLNFLVLFPNAMGLSGKDGQCRPGKSIIGYINEDTKIKSLDWCKYVCMSLKMSKINWIRDGENSYYSRPLTALTCDLISVPRERPSIKYWTTELIKKREIFEISNGGFGLLHLYSDDSSDDDIFEREIVDFVEASYLMYALIINPTVYVSHIRQFWSTARIETTDEETKIITTVDGEPASPLGNDSQGEACPTISSLEAEHNRANIIKTSTLPHDSPPRVTSLAADECSMKHQLNELTDLCTRLQRQQTKMASKLTAQDLEIASLKARIKLLEDRDEGGHDPSGEDTIIKGRSLETGEEIGIERSTDKGSNDTEELVNVLTSLDAASILTSEVQVSVPPAAEVATVSIPPAGEIPIGSGVVPTGSPIFTTAIVATPYSRRKGKEKMVGSETPKKKKLQEQMDVQMARQLEEEMARDTQRMNEQIARNAEITRIHAHYNTKENSSTSGWVLMLWGGAISWTSKKQTCKYEHNADFHQIVDFVEASHLRTVPLFPTMLVTMGEGSGTPTEPYHTPSPEAPQSPQHDLSSSIHLPVTTAIIPTVIPTNIPQLRQYTIRAKIAQSSALLTIADEPASPLGDDSQAQDLEIASLKARIKLLEDRDEGGHDPSGEDTTIKGRILETGEETGIEKSKDKGSNDTEELVNVLTSLDAASILTSEVQVSVPPAAEVATVSIPPAGEIPAGSGVVPTGSPIFTTAIMATPYSRRKVWKQIEDFVPMGTKEEEEIFKRKGLRLEQESTKKVKTSEEVSEEDLKTMMHLMPVEEHFDREDLNQLWVLVKETLNIKQATSDKEKELWVELKRLYKLDVEDQLWTQTQALMHDPVEWRLYDSCGVHHVLSRDQEIFMLVEREYPLRKGLAIVMISNKLQVENYT